MSRIYINPKIAAEYLKENYSDNISKPIDIVEETNKTFFKIFINNKKVTISFFKTTGSILTQPKNIEIEKLLHKINNNVESSKGNLDKYLKNRNNKINSNNTTNNTTHTTTNNTITPIVLEDEDEYEEEDQVIIVQIPTPPPPPTPTPTPKDVIDNSLYVPPIFNKHNNNNCNNINKKIKAYIAHGENVKAQNYIKNILDKLGIEPIILKDEDSKSYTIIESELKKCDFSIILISHEIKYYEKLNNNNSDNNLDNLDNSEYKEVILPNLNVLLEMGLSFGHFGRNNTIVIEFGLLSENSNNSNNKLSNQMTIQSGITYYQSNNPNLIIERILNIVNLL